MHIFRRIGLFKPRCSSNDSSIIGVTFLPSAIAAKSFGTILNKINVKVTKTVGIICNMRRSNIETLANPSQIYCRFFIIFFPNRSIIIIYSSIFAHSVWKCMGFIILISTESIDCIG